MDLQLSIDFGVAEVIPLPMPKAKVRLRRPSVNDCLTSEELKERILNASSRVGHGICADCPLVQVCDEDCGFNPSNGYLKESTAIGKWIVEDAKHDYEKYACQLGLERRYLFLLRNAVY